MSTRRSTSRIVRELSKDQLTEFNKLIASKEMTVDELTEWLNKIAAELKISRSAVGRYTKKFDARLEGIVDLQAQAKAILSAYNSDGPATDIGEAANAVAMDLVMRKLLETDNLDGADIVDILNALARLETSATRREKVKMQFDRGVTAAHTRIKAEIKQTLEHAPDLMAAVLAAADDAAQAVRPK